MKRISKLMVAVFAIVMVTGAASVASAFSVKVQPCNGCTAPSPYQGIEGNVSANTDGSYTITDAGDLRSLLYQGWTVASTSVPLLRYRTFIAGSANAVVSNSVASFFTVQGTDTGFVAATEGDAITNAPVAGVIKSLKCTTTVAGGTATAAGGTSYVFALRVNQADTALTCTETALLTTCSDSTHSVTVAVGDQLDFGVTPNGTPTALVPKCAAEFDI